MSLDFSESFFRTDYPLDGVHLVEASAGTGKTWNIGNLYSRLLMERGLRVSQLLVVTFTEAATGELRERLRLLLGALRGVLHGGAEGSPDPSAAQAEKLVALLPPGGDARLRARNAVDRALLEFDQAAISTIHAFCGRALRRYAFESGLPFDSEPPDRVREAQLAAAARDWWRRNVALAPGGSPDAELAKAQPGHFSLQALSSLLGQWLSRPDIRPDPGLDEWVAGLRAAAESGDAAARDAAGKAAADVRLLRVAFGVLERWHAERPERKAPDFDDILLGMRAALLGPRRAAFAAALRAEYAAVLVDEFQDTDPVQYRIFREAFLEGPGATPVYFIGDPKQAIYAFRGGDIHAYRAAVAAIPGGRRWSLRENFRSSPGLVGAVNGLFRDAAPAEGAFTFGDAAIPYPGDIRAAGGKLDLAGGAPGVEFVMPPPGAKPDADTVADTVADEIAALLRNPPVLAEKGGGGRPLAPGDIAVLLRLDVKEKGEAIAGRLRARGVHAVVRNKDLSVLRTAEAESFRLLLAAFAEPSHAETVRAALLTPFFGLGAAAAAALAKPDGALPPASCPPYPFLARRGNPDAPAAMTDFLRAFREWADLWRDRGFLSAFARMEADLAFRPRIAAGPHGERALVNILHLSEILHAHVSACGALPAAALDWYLRKACGDTGDEACLRLESDEAAVQILSIHASKGLEFPVAVLPDAWKRRKDKSPPPWHVFHRREPDGTPLLCIGVSAEAARAEARELEEEEMRLLYVGITRAAWRCIVVAPELEKDVAVPAFAFLLGRARNAGLCRGACGPGGPAPSAARSPGWLPEPEMPALPPPRGRGSFSSISPDSGAPDGRTPVPADARDLDAGADRALSDPFAAAGSAEAPESHPIFAFPGGTALGSCWHEIFEEADFRADCALLRPLVEKKLLAAGFLCGPGDVRSGRTEAVLDMVRRTLELPLADPEGGVFRLRDIPWEDRASEWEFDFSSRDAADATGRLRDILRTHWGGEPEDGAHRAFLRALDRWDRPLPKGFITGYIDLLFRHGGRYYVVDWKSNALGRRAAAFSPAGIRGEMAAHAYFLQYLVYSAVLHRHLRGSLPGYEWARHFGGVRYIFLRGAAIGRTAVFADRPSESLLDDFATALGL